MSLSPGFATGRVMSLVAAEAKDCRHGGPGLLRAIIAWCQMAARSYRLSACLHRHAHSSRPHGAIQNRLFNRVALCHWPVWLDSIHGQVPISAGAAQRWEQSYVSTVGRLASKILEVVEVRYKFKAARAPYLTCDALPQQHTKIVHFYVYSAIAYTKTLRRFHFDSR